MSETRKTSLNGVHSSADRKGALCAEADHLRRAKTTSSPAWRMGPPADGGTLVAPLLRSQRTLTGTGSLTSSSARSSAPARVPPPRRVAPRRRAVRVFGPHVPRRRPRKRPNPRPRHALVQLSNVRLNRRGRRVNCRSFRNPPRTLGRATYFGSSDNLGVWLSLARALRSGRRGRRFKSFHPDSSEPLAAALDAVVRGSSFLGPLRHRRLW
jgi:hypothetical protein